MPAITTRPSCDGGKVIPPLYGVPRPPGSRDAAAVPGDAGGDAAAGPRCLLAGPCNQETYSGMFHYGTITCSLDGSWWAVSDTYDPPGQVQATEEVYVQGRLCYTRTSFGLNKGGPPVEQSSETGVAPRYPSCSPGCCSARAPFEAQK